MQVYTTGFNFYIGYTFPLTIHDTLSVLNHADTKAFYKIIYIKSGTYHFNLNSKKYVLTGAYALCLNETDQIEFYETSGVIFKIILFLPSIININFNFDTVNSKNDLLSLTENQDLFYIRQFRHTAKDNRKIVALSSMDSNVVEYKIQLLEDLITNQGNNSWPCRSRSYLFEILLCLSRQDEQENNPQLLISEGCSELTLEVIYFLQSCYNQKITIERLTEEFHINRTSLLQDFKKHTGKSIGQYLIELRIRMASTLLRDTKLSIDEICERTGFNDLSYFSRMFKKALYYTPSEYRKNIKGGNTCG